MQHLRQHQRMQLVSVEVITFVPKPGVGADRSYNVT
jgi:hypothetical protein